ncbi:hypothetical protein D9M71_828870 [compost metagenome]
MAFVGTCGSKAASEGRQISPTANSLDERFLLRQLEGARAEMALAVNAYNLNRTISVLGAPQLMTDGL